MNLCPPHRPAWHTIRKRNSRAFFLMYVRPTYASNLLQPYVEEEHQGIVFVVIPDSVCNKISMFCKNQVLTMSKGRNMGYEARVEVAASMLLGNHAQCGTSGSEASVRAAFISPQIRRTKSAEDRWGATFPTSCAPFFFFEDFWSPVRRFCCPPKLSLGCHRSAPRH